MEKNKNTKIRKTSTEVDIAAERRDAPPFICHSRTRKTNQYKSIEYPYISRSTKNRKEREERERGRSEKQWKRNNEVENSRNSLETRQHNCCANGSLTRTHIDIDYFIPRTIQHVSSISNTWLNENRAPSDACREIMKCFSPTARRQSFPPYRMNVCSHSKLI